MLFSWRTPDFLFVRESHFSRMKWGSQLYGVIIRSKEQTTKRWRMDIFVAKSFDRLSPKWYSSYLRDYHCQPYTLTGVAIPVVDLLEKKHGSLPWLLLSKIQDVSLTTVKLCMQLDVLNLHRNSKCKYVSFSASIFAAGIIIMSRRKITNTMGHRYDVLDLWSCLLSKWGERGSNKPWCS